MTKIGFVERESVEDAPLVRAWEAGEATPILEGISRAFWLHRPAYEVCFWVQNTGGVYGGDVSSLSFSSLFAVSNFNDCFFTHKRSRKSMSTFRLPQVNLHLSSVGSRIRRLMGIKGHG